MVQLNELQKICEFLKEIGIGFEFRPLPHETFLPGIFIEAGRIIIDSDQILFPGDLLHEAGHIAIVPEADRLHLTGNIESDRPAESLEMGAILWSYAALQHLGFPPAVVFHDKGYKGQSKWLIEQFERGNYIGLPLLQWMGLAYDEPTANRLNTRPFPSMIKWLRA